MAQRASDTVQFSSIGLDYLSIPVWLTLSTFTCPQTVLSMNIESYVEVHTFSVTPAVFIYIVSLIRWLLSIVFYQLQIILLNQNFKIRHRENLAQNILKVHEMYRSAMDNFILKLPLSSTTLWYTKSVGKKSQIRVRSKPLFK